MADQPCTCGRPHLIEATINPNTGERTVIFATTRGEHTFTIKDAADEVWAALEGADLREPKRAPRRQDLPPIDGMDTTHNRF